MASTVVVDMRLRAVEHVNHLCGCVHVQRAYPVYARTVFTLLPVAKQTGIKLIAENRRSRHDYELLERVEAGIVLMGTEVKSLRAGHVQLGAAFADIRDGEMWLVGASIAEYSQGNSANHESSRDRKLLLKRNEIDSLYAKVREKGLTLVPTKLYFKDGKVKIEVALGRGKDKGDKRRTIADRDAKRQMERALKSRR